MPAQLDDPTTPIHYRRSGVMPYPTAATPMPPGIVPCEVTLRDGSKASIFPFNSPSQLPASLVQSVCDTLGRAILDGNTYPMLEPLPLEVFAPYWFGVFGVVMLQGDVESGRQMLERGMQGNGSVDWDGLCLGSFYTKPNYPGRSSHVCNAGFLVAEMARGKGVGRTMGEQYLDWAPKLVRATRSFVLLRGQGIERRRCVGSRLYCASMLLTLRLHIGLLIQCLQPRLRD